MTRFDYALVGGGLQNGLLTLALRAHQPAVKLCLLERADQLGGNHTWCFHQADVSSESLRWVEPLVHYRWDGYDVVFPERRRTMSEPYSGLSSEHLHSAVVAAIEGHDGSELRLGTEVIELGADSVALGSGEEIRASAVVDARGPEPTPGPLHAGYQKFFGLEVELEADHGLPRPILMDATVDQKDGFRFFYVLPLGKRTLLVEDTYFHDSPSLAHDEARRGVRSYVEERGWRIAEVVREEAGVLPMPWSGTFRPQRSAPLRAGFRGGWYHPGTGYSFPVAVRLAELVAKLPPSEIIGPELAELASEHKAQVVFAEFLNRMLFRWYPPHHRRGIFERFYGLPADTIRHFYALQLRSVDRARLLSGRPPKGLSLRHRLS